MKCRAIVFLLVLLLPMLGAYNYWQYANKQKSLQHEQSSFNSLESNSLNYLFQLPNNVLLHLTGIEKNNFKKLSFSVDEYNQNELNNLIDNELNGAHFSIVKINNHSSHAEIWVLTGNKFNENEQLSLLYSNFSLLENPTNENNEILISNFVSSLIKPEIVAFNTSNCATTITLQETTHIVLTHKPSSVSPPPDLFLEKNA